MPTAYDPEDGKPKDVDDEELEEVMKEWREEILDPISDELKVRIRSFMPSVGIGDGDAKHVDLPFWFARRLADYIQDKEIVSNREEEKKRLMEEAEKFKESGKDTIKKFQQKICEDSDVDADAEFLPYAIKKVAYAELYPCDAISHASNIKVTEQECDEDWWGGVCVFADRSLNGDDCLFCGRMTGKTAGTIVEEMAKE